HGVLHHHFFGFFVVFAAGAAAPPPFFALGSTGAAAALLGFLASGDPVVEEAPTTEALAPGFSAGFASAAAGYVSTIERRVGPRYCAATRLMSSFVTAR